MIGWIIQVTALSLCLIAVMHYLYVFFKTTLTVPKVKDLVNRPQKQYDALFKGVSLTTPQSRADSSMSGETTSISMLPPLQPQSAMGSSTSSMKDELKQFLKNLNRTDIGSGRGL